MKKYTPFMPISVPEIIEVGQHSGKFAVRYRDENGLVQTHFPFHSSKIAWAYAVSIHYSHFKIPLISTPVAILKEGDLVMDNNYNLIRIIGEPQQRDNLFEKKVYCALGVDAAKFPHHTLEFLVYEAYKLPIENEDFVI